MGLAHAKPSADLTLPDVAEGAVDSVVNIASTKRLIAHGGRTQHPLFDGLFGHRGMPRQFESNSLGSGVIISKDGLILTNSHVVKDTTDIKVTLADNRELSAQIVGVDPKSDVALLRVTPATDDLKPMKIGAAEMLRLGETVVAVGNPFGLGHTVTQGIVSAKGRAGMGITEYENFIQTDAAINPGNSGGALVNMRGELVGINTAIFSRSGGHQGIGFAIPSEMAAQIKDSLLKDGRVKRGFLGIRMQDLETSMLKHFGIPQGTRGVVVADVLPGTPADRAGLQVGDVLLSVNGKQAASISAVRTQVALLGQGGRATLLRLRDGNRDEVVVRLGELPEQEMPEAERPKGQSQKQRYGLQLAPLDPRFRARLGLENDELDGVVIMRVEAGSPADRAGLDAGDVVTHVDRKPVQSVKELADALKPSTDGYLVRVWRRGMTAFKVLPPLKE